MIRADGRPKRGSAIGKHQQTVQIGEREQSERDSMESRAAMRMTLFWRDQGKRDEARELLAPAYGWFTEGFDTLDLKEAKALLDELVARLRLSCGTRSSV